ncbi:Leucine rich repeat protein [Spraguea lophii 42_110]|uniref:Leucine rich repeat protein n=1 Tax=Spraguea lophii (strain 42_110) TaxID=1358809 RepID=S7W9G0_SPRLO|nr:Leucine rich repeat protein [Spraguea lophii 42_110]
MYLLYLTLISCTFDDFIDLNTINSALGDFLRKDDYILKSDDELYIFFNDPNNEISVKMDEDNDLDISFIDNNNNILPNCLSRLVNITDFNLAKNNLTSLPSFFENYQSLLCLDLSKNRFNTIPKVIYSLTNLLALWLDHNLITAVCENFYKTKIQILSLNNNFLEYLPQTFQKCTHLPSLNLSNNTNIIRNSDADEDIQKDIDFWKKLPSSIQTLELENIRMKKIYEFVEMKNLILINIKSNMLKEVPMWFSECNELRIFNAVQNDLKEFPESLYKIKNLKKLYLNGNYGKSSIIFSKDVFTELLVLNIDSYTIDSFYIGGNNFNNFDLNRNHDQWSFLQTENIEYYNSYIKSDITSKPFGIMNSLKFLSVKISNEYILPDLLIFPNLDVLKISNDDDSELPIDLLLLDNLQQLTKLSELHLYNFNIYLLPDQTLNLHNLTYLYLDNCMLLRIPDEIKNMQNLKTVSLNNNLITEIDPNILLQKQHYPLYLLKNTITYFPPEINSNNFKSVIFLTYSKQMKIFGENTNEIGLLEVSYKKVSQIKFKSINSLNLEMDIKEIYEKVNKKIYKWKLDKILKIIDTTIGEHQKNYGQIEHEWNIIKNYITEKSIQESFNSYFQSLYNIKKRKSDGDINEKIIKVTNRIKDYTEVIFEKLISFEEHKKKNVIDIVFAIIHPSFTVCYDGQLEHFIYAYNFLSGNTSDNSIYSFIHNALATIKQGTLREITTSNTEEENVHIFSYWKNKLSHDLGIPNIIQAFALRPLNFFLRSKEYVIYQFFNVMNVEYTVSKLRNIINQNKKIMGLTALFLKKESKDLETFSNLVEHSEDIEYFIISAITDEGIIFLLDKMGLIERIET